MLEIKQVKKQYDHFMLDCSLQVKPGHITALIGENGAGKSTTFKAVLGLISIDSGRISLFGRDSGECTLKDKQQLGVVLSDSGFSNYLNAKDIMRILSQMYEHFDKARFLDQLQRMGLPLDKKLKEFSTGMKAKLKLLTALSHQAKLLILDEPTAGLDVMARDEMLNLLREYMEEDEERSILISSHISSDLEQLADDVYMIAKGSIVLHEDTDVLLSNYAVLKLTEEQFVKIDRSWIKRVCRESYGYRALTDQKQFYLENDPDIVIEKSSIDDVILMMTKGETL